MTDNPTSDQEPQQPPQPPAEPLPPVVPPPPIPDPALTTWEERSLGERGIIKRN